MLFEDVNTDTKEAESVSEYLIRSYDPSVLEKVVAHLEKALRRIAIQNMLSSSDVRDAQALSFASEASSLASRFEKED